MQIQFTPAELKQIYCMTQRKIDACANDNRHHRDYGVKVTDTFKTNLQGYLSEYAVAKFLGVPYTFQDYDPTAHDVAGYEVRATYHANGRLLTQPHDKNALYILVIIDPSNQYVTLVGWSNLKRCNTAGRWATDLPKPCYAMPQTDLWPLDMLPETPLYRIAKSN